ncbi:hypothetical protein P8864_20935 [Priestia flexa]|nr:MULTISPECIES: hypothetical protein [Priestia]MCG7315561.1 hypothetical protein [Priestia flexa]MEC0668314.1 hypothetical protein [Priestia flexa]
MNPAAAAARISSPIFPKQKYEFRENVGTLPFNSEETGAAILCGAF